MVNKTTLLSALALAFATFTIANPTDPAIDNNVEGTKLERAPAADEVATEQNVTMPFFDGGDLTMSATGMSKRTTHEVQPLPLSLPELQEKYPGKFRHMRDLPDSAPSNGNGTKHKLTKRDSFAVSFWLSDNCGTPDPTATYQSDEYAPNTCYESRILATGAALDCENQADTVSVFSDSNCATPVGTVTPGGACQIFNGGSSVLEGWILVSTDHD